MGNFKVSELICYTITGIFMMLVSMVSVMATEDSGDSTQSTKRVTLVYEPTNNPPQALGRGTKIDWSRPGLTLELLRMVEDRLGIEFKYKRMPWKRGLYLVEKNEMDGIFHASYKEERESIGIYPKLDGQPDKNRAIFFQSYVLYKLKDSLVEFDGKEITHVDGRIGTINDYAITGDLIQRGYNVDEARTQEINFDKLVKGRIVAFAMLENMADDFLLRNSDKYTNIVKVQIPLKTKAYYLLLSRKFVEENGELAEQIWKNIAEIKSSAAFKAIVANY